MLKVTVRDGVERAAEQMGMTFAGWQVYQVKDLPKGKLYWAVAEFQ